MGGGGGAVQTKAAGVDRALLQNRACAAGAATRLEVNIPEASSGPVPSLLSDSEQATRSPVP